MSMTEPVRLGRQCLGSLIERSSVAISPEESVRAPTYDASASTNGRTQRWRWRGRRPTASAWPIAARHQDANEDDEADHEAQGRRTENVAKSATKPIGTTLGSQPARWPHARHGQEEQAERQDAARMFGGPTGRYARRRRDPAAA